MGCYIRDGKLIRDYHRIRNPCTTSFSFEFFDTREASIGDFTLLDFLDRRKIKQDAHLYKNPPDGYEWVRL